MTWKDRISLGLCGRAGCTCPPVPGANFCAPHWEDQRMRTQHSTWRKRHSGVWRQESIVVMQSIGGVLVAVPLFTRTDGLTRRRSSE